MEKVDKFLRSMPLWSRSPGSDSVARPYEVLTSEHRVVSVCGTLDDLAVHVRPSVSAQVVGA
jgi:hypothetical protein